MRFRALGGSMFPTIRSGDVLTVRRCRPEAVGPGDIVLVRDGDRLFVHRLVETATGPDGPRLITRGDSHWRSDPARPATAVLGVVIAQTRNGRVLKIRPHETVVHRVVGLGLSQLTWLARRLCSLPFQPLHRRGSARG